jgi:large subunit ribosomal protein L22
MSKKNVLPPVAAEAKLSTVLIKPYNMRLAAGLIRGKTLEHATRTLILEKVKSARILLKLLRSAMANAQQKETFDLDRLYVSELQVNEGPRIKRFMPRAQGRADTRVSRTSHVILKLSEKASTKKAASKKKTSKAAGVEK